MPLQIGEALPFRSIMEDHRALAFTRFSQLAKSSIELNVKDPHTGEGGGFLHVPANIWRLVVATIMILAAW